LVLAVLGFCPKLQFKNPTQNTKGHFREDLMTQTVQPRSWATLSNAGEDLNKPKAEEDNRSLLLSVFDSLNELYEKLNRLNYVIKRKNIELSIYNKNKKETK